MNIDFNTNTINYPTHAVILRGDAAPHSKEAEDALNTMAAKLPQDGSLVEHTEIVSTDSDAGRWVVLKRI